MQNTNQPALEDTRFSAIADAVNQLSDSLDEIGIWSRALTSTLYNSGNGIQYLFTGTTINLAMMAFFLNI